MCLHCGVEKEGGGEKRKKAMELKKINSPLANGQPCMYMHEREKERGEAREKE